MGNKNSLCTSSRKVADAEKYETEYDPKWWDDMGKKDKRREEILKQVDEPFLRVLTHWRGTVLYFLALNPMFWFTIAVYVGVRVQARLGLPDFVADLGSANIAVIGGFISFFLVFYVNQNHKRFMGFYNDSMACKGRIFDVATLAATTLPEEMATRLVRYMNAAHAATGYVGLSKFYSRATFFEGINKELRLLTIKELKRMDAIKMDEGGSCNQELIAWCMKDIQYAKKEGLLDNELMANLLREQVLGLRAKIGQLYNAQYMPIPFFYVHFIVLLSALYLPLFAVTAAIKAGTGDDVYWSADVVGGLVVVLQATFVLGLRILGMKMNDPYGKDSVDFCVHHFVDRTWTMSNRILESHFQKEASLERGRGVLRKVVIPLGMLGNLQADETLKLGLPSSHMRKGYE